MSTIYQLLKQDHREVSKLFKQAKKVVKENPDEAKEIFLTIKEELVAHAKAEEEVFYNPLKAKSEQDEAQDVAEEGTQEHHVVALLIKELSQLDCNLPEWEAKLVVLSELVEHHVEEEEGEIFTQARKVFSSLEAKEMAQEMERLKEDKKAQIDSLLNKEAKQLVSPLKKN